MNRATAILNKHLVPALTVVSENPVMAAIRAGMVSVAPLTIIGGLFLVIIFLPVNGWNQYFLLRRFLRMFLPEVRIDGYPENNRC